MKKSLIIAGIMALLLLVSVLVGTSDVVLAQGHRGGHDGKGFWANLTEEQREAVQEKREEMRSQGATREEIHAAVTEMLNGYGIEVPEDSAGPHGPGCFGPGPGGFWKDLTEEQSEAVREKIKEMRSQGSTREEIHTLVSEMLKGYGIEVPRDWKGPHGPIGFGANLTDEQREAIREKIREMKSQGAKREEIRTAVAEMLKGYGIEVPKDWRGPIGFGQRHDGWGANLTDEQREAVREKIKEMRSQGASREEIHAAVAEMIKGYGEESPGNSESQSSETTPAESHIMAESYPNPFNPETQIDYTLSVSEKVRIQIYNITGQLIRTFDQGYQPAGSYSLRWDGRNENGDPAASGVYLYRIEAGPYTLTNRMVLLK